MIGIPSGPTVIDGITPDASTPARGTVAIEVVLVLVQAMLVQRLIRSSPVGSVDAITPSPSEPMVAVGSFPVAARVPDVDDEHSSVMQWVIDSAVVVVL